MKFNQLGNSEIKVSEVSLGTMTWGEQNTLEEAHSQLDLAIERKINLIDTAEMYSVPGKQETQGSTERILGEWMNKGFAKQNREKIVLATKAAGPAEWLNYLRGGPRLNHEHIIKACEDSLSRLKTDYIDLYQIHWPERKTNFFGSLGFTPQENQVQLEKDTITIQETLEALSKLVEQGKVKQIGISNETSWGTMKYTQLALQFNLPQIVSIQNPYSLLNRSFEVGNSEVCYRENIGLLAYSTLGFGTLTGKYRGGKKPEGARLTLFERMARYNNAQADAAIEEYFNIAQEFNLSLASLALAFVNSRPFVASNILGATSTQQLEENINSIEVEITPEILNAIEKVQLKYSNPCP
ncbi:aldo/keto reductase [bacterium]|nr:aldo/keto reductase [bacterium]